MSNYYTIIHTYAGIRSATITEIVRVVHTLGSNSVRLTHPITIIETVPGNSFDKEISVNRIVIEENSNYIIGTTKNNSTYTLDFDFILVPDLINFLMAITSIEEKLLNKRHKQMA